MDTGNYEQFPFQVGVGDRLMSVGNHLPTDGTATDSVSSPPTSFEQHTVG